MFDSKLVEQLEKQNAQIFDLLNVCRTLIAKLEAQNRSWEILSQHVAKLDNSERPAFGVSR